MAKHAINIQDGFLFQSLKEAREMRVSLVTGAQLGGRLKRFDRFAIVLEKDGQELLVYKHAIATIGAAAAAPNGVGARRRRAARDRRHPRNAGGWRTATGLAVALALAGCASRGPAPAPGPRVDRELLPYLLPPSSGFTARADAELLRRIDAAFQSELLDGDVAGAEAAAAASLATDPAFAPAEVLRGQARLLASDPEGAGATLAPVIARYPDYTAAQLAAARAAERARRRGGGLRLPTVASRSASPLALERAGELHARAVAAVAARVEDALRTRRGSTRRARTWRRSSSGRPPTRRRWRRR